MNKCVNQHFVPQYYLKNFSLERKLYVFDKKINRYLANGKKLPISKIGFSKNIYDVNPKLLQPFLSCNIDDEKFLDRLIEKSTERVSAPFINSFVELGDNVYNNKIENIISLISTEDLVDFVIVQLTRTSFYKSFTEIIAELIMKKLAYMKIENVDLRTESLTALTHNLIVISAIDKTNSWKTKSKKRLLKPEYHFIDQPINNIIQQLKKMSKTFWVSSIDEYFITSDNPILIAAGSNQKVENVTFPITKRCSFTFSNLYEHNNSIILINDNNIELIKIFNEKILKSAERFTYAFKKNN